MTSSARYKWQGGRESKKRMPSFNLTKEIKNVLKGARKPKTALEIRDALLNRGFKPEEYSNHMASIHAILKRLIRYEKIKEVR